MIGTILKELRQSRNYTIARLCDLIGMNSNTYAKYEREERDVSTETLAKFADFYGVTTDYLLGRPEAEPPADPVDEFVSKTQMLSNEQAALKKWLMLDEKKRKAVLDIMAEIIHEYESD